jgi:hypothetical protein
VRRLALSFGHRPRSGLALGFALTVALAVFAPDASAEPPTTHEIIYTRPSGFWTSNRPAVGGAYRWRLLGIGVGLIIVTGYGMLRLVRRANAERDARPGREGLGRRGRTPTL